MSELAWEVEEAATSSQLSLFGGVAEDEEGEG